MNVERNDGGNRIAEKEGLGQNVVYKSERHI